MRTEGRTDVHTDRRTDIAELIFSFHNLANAPKMTDTCVVIRGITMTFNFNLSIELITSIEVTVVYFNTPYSHLEGQTEEWLCVSSVSNPTGIRGGYPLNVS